VGDLKVSGHFQVQDDLITADFDGTTIKKGLNLVLKTAPSQEGAGGRLAAKVKLVNAKNGSKVFEKSYDFITTTEVIEHLHNPYEEILKLWKCLKPSGVLGIMTAFRPDEDKFADWYYKRDATHVRFFTKDSFSWLANKLDAEIFIPQSDIVILKKRDR